jgi:hypothetical protein
MNFKFLAMVLGALAIAAPARAQLDNAPPNAVEEQSFVLRQTAEPPAEAGVSYVFEQLNVPAEAREVIPMAPRSNRASEPDLVAQPSSRN